MNMSNNFILDTTILIDYCFGSKNKKNLIENKTVDSQKFATYLILGEFNRAILVTIKKLLNLFLRNEKVLYEFENIDDFIHDIIKDMYFFSKQEANRVIKLIPYLREEIESKIERYQKYDILLKYPIKKIIDDVNMYKFNLLSDIMILKSSYECKNYLRKLILKLEENIVNIEKPYCTLCERKTMKYFNGKYISEINLFHKNIHLLTKQFSDNEKTKLIEALNFLLQMNDGIKVNGRKHICWNLTDIFLVLEAPKDFIILTTNVRHQASFAKCIEKKISGIE